MFREPTVTEERSIMHEAELQSELQELRLKQTALMKILVDIANGNVTKHDPNFASPDRLADDTRATFQERLNTFLQGLARSTLDKFGHVHPGGCPCKDCSDGITMWRR